MDQLLDAPSTIDTSIFINDEMDWFQYTLPTLVRVMSVEKREGPHALGNAVHDQPVQDINSLTEIED